MAWTDVDLVGMSTEMEKLPEGVYLWALLPGAKYNQWNPQKLELGAKVVEGEYAGRVTYFSYGDPDKTPSMYGAFKRLEIALAKSTGVAIEEGQDPIAYLNEPSVVGGKFTAPIKYRTYTAEGKDEPETKVEIAIFKVKPVTA